MFWSNEKLNVFLPLSLQTKSKDLMLHVHVKQVLLHYSSLNEILNYSHSNFGSQPTENFTYNQTSAKAVSDGG